MIRHVIQLQKSFSPEFIKIQFTINMLKIVLVALLACSIVQAEIMPFDNSAIEKIFQEKSAAVFLFTSDNEASVAAKAAFDKLDETNPEGVILTVSDKNDGHGLFDRLSEYLGVDVAETPKVLFLGSKTEKYQYNYDEINAENLATFVEQVQKGEIDQYLKSAAIPEENDEYVRTVVGKNFKQVVLESEKEFLVKFYAPWCGHCKSLVPHYEEAAKKLATANPNIVLVKVDSTENEVAGVDIQGFPTLKFWGKDKSVDPIDFNGERTTDGILAWLKDHSSYEWSEDVQPAESEL